MRENEDERCNCCGEYIGDEDSGTRVCSCDTGQCPFCRGRNSVLR